MTEIIRKLLEYFKKNNIKGTEIAEILGLKKSPLTDWKNGHSKPTIEQLIIICEKLALSLDELTGLKSSEIQNAYNAADPGTKAAIRKLLDIKDEEINQEKSSNYKIGQINIKFENENINIHI